MRVPEAAAMKLIYEATNGKVTPNDFVIDGEGDRPSVNGDSRIASAA